ncbi:uncharacterized protein si:dkey-56m19.5 [Stegostoma tigrinum]|uniref:uncharacterized protein si:dkey-56m19.5 n=1 Tax=Stegostoma tigrinum TaxID=3053191 RepID=UPI00202B2DF4|nr:uncharacterized protein si:dkey-56m19.5 [Stegostoma tigrinum]
MSRPSSQSLQSRWAEWRSSLCCCRAPEPNADNNSMGGRLSRKRRGYNVNDPKESKSAAESTDQPESKDVSKEQFKTPEAELPVQQPDEAPKITETTAGNQIDTTVTTEGKAANDAQDHEAALSSEATCTNSVKATEQPSQEGHQTTKAEIESSSTACISSSAEVNVPVSSEEVPLNVAAVSSPNEEAQEKPVLPSKHESEGLNLPTDKQESGHAAPKITEDNKQPKSGVNLDAEVQSSQASEGIAETSEQELTKTQGSLSEQAESSTLETKSEPGAENVPHETETPKFSEITEETLIDLVLKNEMAKCADIQKNLSGPGSMDEVQDKMVSESTHTIQVVADLTETAENSDQSQDGSGQGVTNKVPEDQGQLLGSSGNLSVDTLREESVTDSVPVELKDPEIDPVPNIVSVPEATHVVTQSPDPVMAECAPGTPPPVTEVIPAGSPDPTAECSPETLPHPKKELSETRLEQTLEMSHQDSAEIALLNSSSEKIPAIKLTVYTEALQEEKIEMDTEPMTKESLNHFDTNDPDPQNEVLPEIQSTSCSAELISEQEIVNVGNTSEHPVPESQSSSDVGEQSLADLTKTEATVSTEPENVSVDAASSQTEKTSLETPIANGTPLDARVEDSSKSMSKINGQDATAEDSLQDKNCDMQREPTKHKSIEQADRNRSLEESDQTLDSGQSQ